MDTLKRADGQRKKSTAPQSGPAALHRLLLEINNAIITHTDRESLFQAISGELSRHILYDRLSINLYNAESGTLSYFAAADGVTPEGISCRGSRPLSRGSIACMVIESERPVVISELTRYAEMPSVKIMLQAGLRATMAYPLIIRRRILGSIHFSFRKMPEHEDQMNAVLAEVSKQVSIAVDNMIAHTRLKNRNESLEQERRRLLTRADDTCRSGDLIFQDRGMVQIMEQIPLVADTDATVLITGETGTGKGYLARHIHDLSRRRDRRFVQINCPALAPSLFESELFGHAKGSFTGAENQRMGRLEMAEGGTAFFDEIGELPGGLQAKLLHVLQDHRLERVGSSRPIDVNFRVIAATNQGLEEAIAEGRFRRDLFYRLNAVSFRIPPLRERPDDIPLLLVRLSAREAERINRPAPVFTESAFAEICRHSWPGNIRELKNLILRLFIFRPGDRITEKDVRQILAAFQSHSAPATTLAEMERHHIIQALIRSKGILGGKNGAANRLALPRSTLQYRLKKHGITPSDYL